MAEHGGKDGRPLSSRSVAFARGALRKACADAVAERILEVNPVAGSRAPKADGKPKHVTWTGAQQRAFLEGIEASRWRPVWVLALAASRCCAKPPAPSPRPPWQPQRATASSKPKSARTAPRTE